MDPSMFAVSREAVSWILRKLEFGDSSPETAGQIPGLYFFLDKQCRDEQGQVFEWLPTPFFDVCWQSPDIAKAEGYIEIDVGGRKLVSPPDAVEKLKHMELFLETIEVGYPTPGTKRDEFLRIRPRREGTA